MYFSCVLKDSSDLNSSPQVSHLKLHWGPDWRGNTGSVGNGIACNTGSVGNCIEGKIGSVGNCIVGNIGSDGNCTKGNDGSSGTFGSEVSSESFIGIKGGKDFRGGFWVGSLT